MNRILKKLKGLCEYSPYWFGVFSVLVLGSLYFRYLRLPVLSGEAVSFLTINPDSATYLRQFDLVLSSLPFLPASIDYYSNYPWGLEYFLPPVWPYLLAILSLPIAAVFNLEPTQAAGVVVLIVSVAIAIPIYILAKELFGRRVGLASAAISLFYPRFMLVETIGIDHHMADVFLAASVFALYVVSRRHLGDGNRSRFIGAAVFAGALIALSMLISLSLVLIIGLLFLPVLIALFVLAKDELSPIMGSLGAVFGSAAAILGALALVTPWFSNAFEFSRLSLLHVAILGAIAAFGAIVYYALQKGAKLSQLRVIAGSSVLLATMACVLVPYLNESIYRGYLRSIGSYALGNETLELHSLLSYGLANTPRALSDLVFIAPLTVVGLISRDLRRRSTNFESLFIYTILTVLSYYTFKAFGYYSMYLSIILLIIYGLGVVWAAHLLVSCSKRYGRRIFRLDATAVFVSALALAVVIVGGFSNAVVLPNANLLAVAEYITANTERPGDFSTPTRPPAYSIMCKWTESYQIEYLAQRATVSTGNHDTGREGILASERFFQAESEEEALIILKDAKAKYIVASDKITVWQGDIERILEPMPNFGSVVRPLTANELAGRDTALTLMSIRLYWATLMALPKNEKAPLHNIRLIYAGNLDSNYEPVLLYEVVEGARLEVRDKPGSKVSIWTNIKDKSGNGFTWRATGIVDSTGVFSTTTPYSTKGNQASITAEPYRLEVGQTQKWFDIEENTVVDGTRVILNTIGKE